MTEYKNLTVEIADGIARVTMAREGGMNAFDTIMYGEMRHAMRRLEDDDSVSVVLFESAGKAFAVGGDLKEMLCYLHDRTPSDQDIFRFQDNLPFDAIRFSRKPTIAVIRGLCVGGGLGLAVSCDFAIATEESRFGAPEARSGLIDGLLPSMLYDAVPLQALKYLLYTGKLIAASEAMSMGLIFKTVPGDAVEQEAIGLVESLKLSSLDAIASYKAIFASYARRGHLDEALRLIRLSSDTRERLLAFSNRPAAKSLKS